MPSRDIAPCISSRRGAGCTPSMVPSGRIDEGRARRSRRGSSSCQRVGMGLKLNISPALSAGHWVDRSRILKLQVGLQLGGVVLPPLLRLSAYYLLSLIVTWIWLLYLLKF